MKKRVIFHIDLDAFFASCEERENPRFQGKPLVVGADPKMGKGRGVVSTANYEARKFDIHSAMPISQAWRLCPSAIFLPVNSALYNHVSNSVMAIIQNFAKTHNGKFEQVSIDEGYLDLFNFHTNLTPHNRDREYLRVYIKECARKLKTLIVNEEKITASIGVGPNMLIAKIASDFKKPNGLTIVYSDEIQNFLDPLDVRRLPGVGPKTEFRLKKLKINTVLDLRKFSQSYLYETFGEHGIRLYNSAHGIDTREVATTHETKSIGEEHTFDSDTEMLRKILPVFFNLIKNVVITAESKDFFNFKTITIKVRYADFKTHTKSRSSQYNASGLRHIEETALKLLWPYISHGKKIRLIGFRIEKFSRLTS